MWNKNYKQCIRCGSTKNEHHSKGRCIKCFEKERYRRKREYYQKYYKKYFVKNRNHHIHVSACYYTLITINKIFNKIKKIIDSNESEIKLMFEKLKELVSQIKEVEIANYKDVVAARKELKAIRDEAQRLRKEVLSSHKASK